MAHWRFLPASLFMIALLLVSSASAADKALEPADVESSAAWCIGAGVGDKCAGLAEHCWGYGEGGGFCIGYSHGCIGITVFSDCWMGAGG